MTAISGTREGRVASASWREPSVGEPAMLIIRPEDATVYTLSETPAEANGWKRTVLAGVYIGEAVDYVVDVAGAELNCRVDSRERRCTGSEAFLHIAPKHVQVLPVSV